MAKPLISDIETTQTFQNWLNKTNEMVGIFRTNAVTAGSPAETTVGDAILTGDFTGDNIIIDPSNGGSLQSDVITAATPSGGIEFQSAVDFVGTTATTVTFTYAASGGQARFTDGSFSWDIGIDDTQDDANFIINTGVDPVKFQLSPAGVLRVPSIICSGTISASNFSGGSQFSTTDDITEGTTNLFFTDARARGAFTAGSNIDIGSDGTIAVEDVLDCNEFRAKGAAGASTAAYIDGGISVGQPQGKMNVTFGGSSYEVANWNPSGFNVTGDFESSGGGVFGNNVTVTGNLQTTGNVITAYSASDRRLKENLDVISDPLTKIMDVNGYTFNYIGGTERVSGVVAQEIERVLPEVVYDHQKPNGTFKAVRLEGVVPLLLEAIKELKLKVDELEERLNTDAS